MNLQVSTMLYALGKRLGMKGALEEFGRQLEKPTKESLPAARTIYRFRLMADVRLWVDCGATCIGKARSRAFAEAFESGSEAWVSVDDDSEVTTETCAAMLEVLADALHPRVVVVPFLMRDSNDINVSLPQVRVEENYAGAKLLRLAPKAAAGFGMVGMNRAAMKRIVSHHLASGGLTWNDHGKSRLALFYDLLDVDGTWYTEDVSFFRRLPDDLGIDVLCVGASGHGGQALPLDQL